MQSRKHSLIEVVTSTLVGYVIALCSQMVIYPLYGIEFTFMQNVEIAAIFTVISIIRAYFFRRVFNFWVVHGVCIKSTR